MRKIIVALLLTLAFPVSAQVPPPAGLVVGNTPVQGGSTDQCLYKMANGRLGAQACTSGGMPLSGGTMTGTLGLKGLTETFTAPAITANVLTIDLSLGTVFNVANNANISTFTISNAVVGRAAGFTLVMTANGSGFTQAWGASVKWAGGAAPTLTTTNGKIDVLTFATSDGGTSWYGFTAGQNF